MLGTRMEELMAENKQVILKVKDSASKKYKDYTRTLLIEVSTLRLVKLKLLYDI
jgi:hypothetical protein